MFIAFAVYFFEVPFRGSLALLYLGTFVYLLAVIGVGLFISSLSQTRQQAFLGAFLFAAARATQSPPTMQLCRDRWWSKGIWHGSGDSFAS